MDSKSLNPDGVSLGIVKNQNEDRTSAERRRVPRLCLTTEQFRLAANGRIFSISDLSAEGMALRVLDREDLALFPVGHHFEGTLNLRREKYQVQAQVRHLGRELVGCEFKNLDSKVVEALRSSLDPAALGQELKPIPAADGVTLWYHGPSGTDLLFWRHTDGQYVRFVLFVLGSYVQWEENVGLSTGRLTSSFEQSEIRGVVRLETMLLNADATVDNGKVEVARILASNSSLPQDLKKWCTRQLTGSHE